MDNPIIIDPDKSQSISDWEREQNEVITHDGELNHEDIVTGVEFQALLNQYGRIGVDINYREKWLEKNGYEVTPENIINPDLSTRVF